MERKAKRKNGKGNDRWEGEIKLQNHLRKWNTERMIGRKRKTQKDYQEGKRKDGTNRLKGWEHEKGRKWKKDKINKEEIEKDKTQKKNTSSFFPDFFRFWFLKSTFKVFSSRL